MTAFWYALYSGINRANMFLENIDKVNGFDAGVKTVHRRARFLRAFYYFNLVECWGDVPFKTVSTQSVTNLNIPRTDKQEIYDFIVSEMGRRSRDWSEIGLRSCLQAGTYLSVYRMGHTGTCISVPCRRALP